MIIFYRRDSTSFQARSSQVPQRANEGQRVASQPRSGGGWKVAAKRDQHHRGLHARRQVQTATSGRVRQEQGPS